MTSIGSPAVGDERVVGGTPPEYLLRILARAWHQSRLANSPIVTVVMASLDSEKSRRYEYLITRT